MDRPEIVESAVLAGDPHARGDGPYPKPTPPVPPARSPRAWGWTALIQRREWETTEIPTRVGMDRPPSGSEECRRREIPTRVGMDRPRHHRLDPVR